MHKFILKVFNFLKNSANFIKIVVLFCTVMFFLFWAQNLLKADWGFLNFIEPTFNSLLNVGTKISDEQISLSTEAFELKYFGVLLVFALVYGIGHILYIGFEFLEDLYDDSRRLIKKTAENKMNSSFRQSIEESEKKLKNYKVYITTSIKKKFAKSISDINLEEQNRVMNKFIIEKTLANPIKYKDGFLYSFANFENIDNILDVFHKILKSDAPLDYIICVQVYGEDEIKENEELDCLISIKLINQISMTASTAYRYKFNSEKKYKVSQEGLFQKDGKTFEVHVFDVE